MLRNVIKSTLPVEVYYFPGEMTDQKIRDEFINDYNVELVESTARKTDGKSWRECLWPKCGNDATDPQKSKTAPSSTPSLPNLSTWTL